MHVTVTCTLTPTCLRDWRIKDSEIKLEEKIAEGTEGEVWRASLLSSDRMVVVKKAKVETQVSVWDEAEVCAALVTCRLPHTHI